MGFSFTPTRLNDLVVDVSLSGVAQGDILYRGASKWNNLAPGNAGDVLTSGGAGASPSWAAAAGGAPFDDATAIVKGSVDATKLLRFEVDGFTAGATRVLTPPDQNGTIAVLEAANSFTVGDQTVTTDAVGTRCLTLTGFSTGQTAALLRLLSNNSTSSGLASLEWLSSTTARALSIAMSGDDGALRLRQSGTEYATININPGSSIGVGFSGTSSGPGISFTANSTGAIIFGSTVSTGAYTVDFGKRASDGAICTAGVYTANYGSWASILNSALTNTVGTYQTFRHRTTGTPAAGFGAGLAFTLNSSTTADQDAALFSTEWVTATHASRAARGKLLAYDTAARECIRFEADGTYGLVGIGGATSALAHMTVNVGAAANKGIVIKAAASQSGDLIEMQDSSGNRRAAFGYDDPMGSSGDSFGLNLRPGSRSYAIGTSDGAGAFVFSRSDSGAAFTVAPDSTSVRFSLLGGSSPNLYIVAVGGLCLSGGEAGGATVIHFGRRPSDNSAAVGTDSRFWAITGQTVPVLSTVAPGQGVAATVGYRFTVDKEGDIYLKYESSTTNARDRFSIVSTWATSTDASRKARAVFNAYDTAARECIRVEASGSAPMVGFLGASAVVRQTGDIAVALENLGLVTAGTSLGPKYLMAAATLMAG